MNGGQIYVLAVGKTCYNPAMVRRITMDEAAADFKGIVERALENGDSLELERDGRIVAAVTPARMKGQSSLRAMFEELLKVSPPDESFADDLQAAVDAQQVRVPENRWDD